MAGFCERAGVGLDLVHGALEAADCNVRLLAETGYSALSAPGSPVAGALTTLLTIYVAILGLRLMLGHAQLRVGELTVTLLKISVVLALATSWETYQHLVFDTLVKGPDQLGGAMLRALRPPASEASADPFADLQAAYQLMQDSALYFTNRSQPVVSPLQGGPGFAALALNASSLLLILNTVGLLVIAKLVLALLIALGPVFIALFLFDSTRGLFEGWIRAAVAFALAPMLAMVSLVIQLTLMRAPLERLAELPGLKLVDTGPPNLLFLMTLIFVGLNLAATAAIGIVAVGFRLPGLRAAAPAAGSTVLAPAAAAAEGAATAPRAAAAGAVQPSSREVQVARAAAAMERRDSRAESSFAGAPRISLAITREDRGAPRDAVPVSRAYRRPAQPRAAASSQRRDR